jgi:hypothetical protein
MRNVDQERMIKWSNYCQDDVGFAFHNDSAATRFLAPRSVALVDLTSSTMRANPTSFRPLGRHMPSNDFAGPDAYPL